MNTAQKFVSIFEDSLSHLFRTGFSFSAQFLRFPLVLLFRSVTVLTPSSFDGKQPYSTDKSSHRIGEKKVIYGGKKTCF